MISRLILEKQPTLPLAITKHSTKTNQINIHFWVSQWSATTIAINHPLRAWFWWHFSYQIDGKIWIYMFRFVNESYQPVVVCFPLLQKQLLQKWKQTKSEVRCYVTAEKQPVLYA